MRKNYCESLRLNVAIRQIRKIGTCKQESIIFDYFARNEDAHVLHSIQGNKLLNFYFVSTTFLFLLLSCS